MSGNAYKSQLIEDIKEIEDDSRELRKLIKQLKKRKRKLKRLGEEDEIMLEVYTIDLANNDSAVESLEQSISQINIKEDEDEKPAKEAYAY